MTGGLEGKGRLAAQSMMKSMGWSEGEGLGKDKQGMTAALKPKKKIDVTGLGAQKYNTNWIAATSAYDAILAKLNVAHSKKAEDEDETTEAAEPVEKASKKRSRDGETKAERKARRKAEKKARRAKEQEGKDALVSDSEEGDADAVAKPRALPARHFMYAKRLKAKQVAGYSSTDKAEIFAAEFKDRPAPPPPAVPYMPPPKPVGQVGYVVGSGSEEEEVEEDEEQGVKRRIDYENGFTEDTQVDIYNLATSKQIKGRVGLGLNKISKSSKKELAIRDAALVARGTYLTRKFIFGGILGQFETSESSSAETDTVKQRKVAVEKSEEEEEEEAVEEEEEEVEEPPKKRAKKEKKEKKADKKEKKEKKEKKSKEAKKEKKARKEKKAKKTSSA